jgi:predicted nucleotidyltransferase
LYICHVDSAIVYDTIRDTVQACLPGSRILLFGSHARGAQNKDSDYDLLIITPCLLTQKEKLSWSSQLHKSIVKAIHAPVDLLMYSEEEITEKQNLPGHIVRTAIREAITL